jgi:hypothetical protein
MLPDWQTVLYEHLRYDLLPALTPSKKHPSKRFLTRREVNGFWVFGAGPRRIPYRWGGLTMAGPGSVVFVAEGEGKTEAVAKAGYVATCVLAHSWGPECVAALTGMHVIILADHDTAGDEYAKDTAKALAGVAASIRIVPYRHLWEHLDPSTRGTEPRAGEDIANWLDSADRGGNAAKLLEICRELSAEGDKLDVWDAGERLNGPKAAPRQWLMYGQFCRKFLSGLVAPGDSGKTSLRLAQAVALATDHDFLGIRMYGGARY